VIVATDRIGRRLRPISSDSAHRKQKGQQIAPPPLRLDKMTYFRLVIAVRSAESLTMPAAPHQFDPTPDGLIGEKLALNFAV